MGKNKVFTVIILVSILLLQCDKNNPVSPPEENGEIEVVINDIPYQTEKFLRIPYTLKMWEYEKEGLELQKIDMIDDESSNVVYSIDKNGIDFLNQLGLIYKDPIAPIPHFNFDKLTHYYLSIQLPIALGSPVPLNISHRLEFKKTDSEDVIVVEGAHFSPRSNETPLVIASPVKGKSWLFASQSWMGYHFNVIYFNGGNLWTFERFAFDTKQFNDDLTTALNGDPLVNESYFSYGDTLYAVADGVVTDLVDDRPENNGNAQDLVPTLNSMNEYLGNYIILDIGGGHYATYAHCIPDSFFVNVNDAVQEGTPLALLGNSGNSGEPHLHFQITDGPDAFFSYGVPFVLKKYQKVNEIGEWWEYWNPLAPIPLLNPPVQTIENSMMEQLTVIDIE